MTGISRVKLLARNDCREVQKKERNEDINTDQDR